MRTLFNRGQIPIMTAIIGAIGLITASVFTSWATANNRVSVIDTKVEVISEREGNHYLELQKNLEQMDKKLDLLLKQK